MATTTFNTAKVLDRLATVAPPCLYALGGAILAVKLLSLSSEIPAWWLAAGAGLIAIGWLVAGLAGENTWYDGEYARAWYDLNNHAGGAIMAGEKPPAGAVRPGITPGHLIQRLALPMLFVAAALVVPEPSATRQKSGAGMERALARIEREIADADEQGALAQPDAEALRRQVERLRELAQNNPEAAAEALASLPERLESAQARRLDTMADAMEKAVDALTELNQAEAGADATPGDIDQSMSELFNTLDRLARNEGGMDNLPEDLRTSLRQALDETGASGLKDMSGGLPGASGMSRETLERLMQNLGEGASQMGGAAQMSLERSAARGEGGVGSLKDALDRLQSQGETCRSCLAGQPGTGERNEAGQGGVSRGPGEAPLVFGEESRESGARFDHRPLPPGELAFPDQMLKRERERPPETMPPEEFRAPVRSGVEVDRDLYAGGGLGTLGPARARAAERYFNQLGEQGDEP